MTGYCAGAASSALSPDLLFGYLILYGIVVMKKDIPCVMLCDAGNAFFRLKNDGNL